MPDGRPPGAAPDYNDDFYAWTQYQAEVLRAMPAADNRFDRENVAEEIEDLGRSYRDAMRSQVRRIIEHLLKLEYSPTQHPRPGWMRSIAEARAEVGDKISRTLRQDTQRRLPKLYAQARELAFLALTEFDERVAAERLPTECRYTLVQILDDGWYPDPAETP